MIEVIKEIINKLDYDKLLTQSDPNINLVRDYLEHGNLYGYFVNNEPVSFIAVEIIDGNVEIKNILTLLSTANSSFENITFYTRLGYVYSHRIENFFLDYYPKEIFENQMQATDLMYFKKSIKNIN